ncbi:uncharacterized protein LOC105182313 [Harpegnathos saltator]|uniref:uncharacterized protein LOC105182313 n=1 Tax=Harpegnathos saltator TaxID=610380 RepID=UPI00058DD393|nr:uncharacterized protein LOC105182313 [Harpegnathos saltator]
MTLEKFIVASIILVWAGDSLAGHHRSRRSSEDLITANEYILHRCTATAELIRRHRNEGVININSRKAEVGLPHPQIQRRNYDSTATILPTNVSRLETPRQTSSSAHRHTAHMRRRVNAHARRIVAKHLADTPLRTLHIDAPHDKPSVFKKKSPLPELEHNTFGRNIDSSQNVIIIKPIT